MERPAGSPVHVRQLAAADCCGETSSPEGVAKQELVGAAALQRLSQDDHRLRPERQQHERLRSARGALLDQLQVAVPHVASWRGDDRQAAPHASRKASVRPRPQETLIEVGCAGSARTPRSRGRQ